MPFADQDRVRVSKDYFWAKEATGTVSAPPPEVVEISGPWEADLKTEEVSASGKHIVYWIWFDEPQLDADGEGPFGGGAIWETALTKL